MPLEIALVDKNDIAEIVRLDSEANKNNGVTQYINKTLAAEGSSRADVFTYAFRPEIEQDKGTFWKVVDSETNTIASVAQWKFQYDETEPAKKKDYSDDVAPPSEQMQAVMQRLFAAASKFAEEYYAGRPHAVLNFLATHPTYQRRGAGRMLMEQGLRMVDEAGLDSFLHASPAGLRLYKKFGFETIRPDTLDLPGIDKVEVRTCMKRPSKIGQKVV